MSGVIYFTIIAFVLSILIVILNNYLFSKKDLADEIEKALPGYNCGACGFGSCSGMADAILKDKDAINKCRILKNKEEILKIIGD